LLRGDRRGGALSHRQRAAGPVHRRRLERGDAEPDGHRAGTRGGRRGRALVPLRAAMRIFSSLTNRIFLGSAALAVLTIAVAVYRINVAVTVQAEHELRRGLEEAGTQLEENRDTLFSHFSREARLISDLSNL